MPWLHAVSYLCFSPQAVGYFQSTSQTTNRTSFPDTLSNISAIFSPCHGLELCFESPSLASQVRNLMV